MAPAKSSEPSISKPSLRRIKLTKSAVGLPGASLVAVAVGLLQLGMVFYLREVRQFSPVSIGLFSAVWWLSYSSGCIIMRPFSARLLPRISIVLSTSLVGVFLVLMFFAKIPILTYLFYGAAGFSLSLFWPPLMGWLSFGLEGSELNLAMSRFNISWSLGMIISPFLTGILSERSPELPIYAAIGLFFLIAGLTLAASLSIPAIRMDHTRDPIRKRKAGSDDKSTPLRYPAWLGLLTTYFVLGVFFNIFPLYSTEALGWSKRLVGVVLLIRALSTTLAFMVLGRISFWHFKARYMLGTQGAFILLMAAFLFSRSLALLAFLFIFVGLLSSSAYVASLFYGVSGSGERARRMAIHEALLALGVISGSSFGGWVYQAAGMGFAYGLLIAVLAAGLVIQTIILASQRSKRRLQIGG